jgi:hypothetical protein
MNKRRDFRFSIRLSPEEKKQLDAISHKKGEGYGATMRRYLEEGVKRDMEKTLSDKERDMIYLHFQTMHFAKAILEKIAPDVMAVLPSTINHNVLTYIKRYYDHEA